MKKQFFVFLFLVATLPLCARPGTVTMKVDYPGNNLSYSALQDGENNAIAPMTVERLDVLPLAGYPAATLKISNAAQENAVALQVEGTTTVSGTLNMSAKRIITDFSDSDSSLTVGNGEIAGTGELEGAEFENLTIKEVDNATDPQLTLGAEELDIQSGNINNFRLFSDTGSSIISGCSGSGEHAKWQQIDSHWFLTCTTD